MTALDPARMASAVGALRTACDTFDASASAAPQSIEAGAATTLVAGWVAQLCASGAEALTVLGTLCEATEAAAGALARAEDDASTTVAFMEAGS